MNSPLAALSKRLVPMLPVFIMQTGAAGSGFYISAERHRFQPRSTGGGGCTVPSDLYK